MTSMYILRFLDRQIECLYFWLDQIQDGGQPPSLKILNGHISAKGRPITSYLVIG